LRGVLFLFLKEARLFLKCRRPKEIDAMYFQPAEWSNLGEPRARDARSIGAVLGEMREIAVLRARARSAAPRNALRRNSA
jgi:hypothetical protein